MVLQSLKDCFPSIPFQVVPVSTHGDQVRDKPLAELGVRGVFVKELEEALLREEVDLVVHSLKDLPTEMPAGLILAAVPCREDPRDALVSHDNLPLEKLPDGATVATSSRRRAAQLRALRQDLKFVDIRGNVDTRLRKHDEGHCDAMVLAAAGLTRLGLTSRIAQYIEPQLSTPAVGQGALAIECRAGDAMVLSLLAKLDNASVRAAITAERAFLHELGGGCSIPIGALATIDPNGLLKLTGCVASTDGASIFRASMERRQEDAFILGTQLANHMLGMGARQVLEELKQTTSNMVSPP